MGRITLLLPGRIGAHVTINKKGLVQVKNYDLVKGTGNSYTNDLYGKSKATLDVVVEMKLGEITLEQGI